MLQALSGDTSTPGDIMRTEKVVKKEASELKMPAKSKKEFTRKELDDLVIRLSEAHGLV